MEDCSNKYIKRKRVHNVCFPVKSKEECNSFKGFKWDNDYDLCFDNSIKGKADLLLLKMKYKGDFKKDLEKAVLSNEMDFEAFDDAVQRKKMMVDIQAMNNKKNSMDILARRSIQSTPTIMYASQKGGKSKSKPRKLKPKKSKLKSNKNVLKSKKLKSKQKI